MCSLADDSKQATGRVVAVVPCLNEAAEVSRVVAGIRRFLDAVLVVDDGSSDNTAELAEAKGAKVIGHATTLGKGASIRRGMEWALDHGFEWALLMDGDGQHDPLEIPRFLEAARPRDKPVDLVIGNRMENPESMPLSRRWVNRWMSRRISAWAGTEVPDTQCGFRLLRLSLWKELPLSTAHYEVDSEVLVEALRKGANVAWVPIRAIYGRERSKIRPWRDTVRWFRWWWKKR